jgi:hypothetical protein
MAYPSFAVLEEWMKYCREVTVIYPNFLAELSKAHPDLTDHQFKLCTLFLFECQVPEIAERMGGISKESVVMAKYRLTKKFKLKRGERLAPYLQRIAAGMVIVPPPRKSSAHFHSRFRKECLGTLHHPHSMFYGHANTPPLE